MSKEFNQKVSPNRARRFLALATAGVVGYLGVNAFQSETEFAVTDSNPQYALCSEKTKPFHVKPGMGDMDILVAIDGVDYPTNKQMLDASVALPKEAPYQRQILQIIAKDNDLRMDQLAQDGIDLNIPVLCKNLGGVPLRNLTD